MARLRRWAALVGSVTMLVCGCALGPSDRPAVAVRDAVMPPAPATTRTTASVPLPPLEPAQPVALNFGDCSTDTLRRLGASAVRPQLRYECTTIGVERNPDEPRRRAGTTSIHVLRTGNGKVPLLVVGDVAGDPGTLLAARLANRVPAEMLDTFTLVGMDRRGTGWSEPVDCVPVSVREKLISIDPGAPQPAGAQAVLDAANDATRTCVQEIEDVLPLIDSWRAAGDLERLRDALGADRLNAIAVGDGSRVLSAYLSRYGRLAGRIVLDGAPDPSLDAIAVGQDLAAGAERAFDAFAADCLQVGCPLSGDPRTALLAVAEKLRANPVNATNGTPVNAGTLFTAVLLGLADTDRWPELRNAIAAAGGGDVNGVAALVEPMLDGVVGAPARLDAALLTTCNDTATRVPPDRVGQLANDWKTRAPLFGALFAQRLLVCSPAPVPTRTVPPPRASALPPLLLLGTDADPVTPLIGTQRMADALPAGIMITWQGNGHGAFPRTPCVTSAVLGFLVGGTLPHNGTTCPP